MDPYIVLFAKEYFFTGRDSDGYARGTLFPSFATGMTYLTAAAVAQALRRSGYKDAIVADLHGQPVLPGETKKDVCEPEEFKRVWGVASSKKNSSSRHR